MKRKPYPSDLSDAQWAILEPLIPTALQSDRPRCVQLREVINAIFYILCGGCTWRMMPHEFSAWKTVYDYFRLWRTAGEWQRLVPDAAGKGAPPSWKRIDSKCSRCRQSVSEDN